MISHFHWLYHITKRIDKTVKEITTQEKGVHEHKPISHRMDTAYFLRGKKGETSEPFKRIKKEKPSLLYIILTCVLCCLLSFHL